MKEGNDYTYLWISGLIGLSVGVWLSPKVWRLPIQLEIGGAITAAALAATAGTMSDKVEKQAKGERAIAQAQQEMFAARLAHQVRAEEIELENGLPRRRASDEEILQARIKALMETVDDGRTQTQQD